MPKLAVTPRNKLGRLPKRGSYDRDTIYAIIDAAALVHLGFIFEGAPCVIPTVIWRQGEHVYIHGSRVSRMIQHLASGAMACLTVTHLDGLVLARSGFHTSMNYRSVVIYASGEVVEGAAKQQAMDAMIEHLLPGRGADLRPHRRKELNATTVLRFPVTEASAKVRTGPPIDDPADEGLPVWSGVIPMRMQLGEPVADDKTIRDGIALPDYIKVWR